VLPPWGNKARGVAELGVLSPHCADTRSWHQTCDVAPCRSCVSHRGPRDAARRGECAEALTASVARDDESMLTRNSKVRIAPGVVFNEVQGETVLLNTVSGRYYGLDTIASRMWQLLQQEEDVGRVHARLLEEFDAGVERLWQDLEHLVEELAGNGLLAIVDANGSATGQAE
jgi:hypothetical protein